MATNTLWHTDGFIRQAATDIVTNLKMLVIKYSLKNTAGVKHTSATMYTLHIRGHR